MKKLLMIEDELSIVAGVRAALSREDFTVDSARDCAQACEKLPSRPDLVLLDLCLPDGDGLALCAKIKTYAPLIILSARDEEADIVRGLDLGADDYVIKPFKISILLSRIHAVMRRAGQTAMDIDALVCGDIHLLPSRTEARRDSQRLDLSAGEYRLLEIFMQSSGRTLTRTQLLDKLWDAQGDFVNDNTLSVLIKRLREKLGGGPQRLIRTIRGIGYRMEADDSCAD